AASTVQDLTDLPSSSTVHAPQDVVSQPTFVAVRFATSRRKCTSSVRSSTSAEISVPLTVRSTFTVPPEEPPSRQVYWRGDLRPRRGAPSRALPRVRFN